MEKLSQQIVMGGVVFGFCYMSMRTAYPVAAAIALLLSVAVNLTVALQSNVPKSWEDPHGIRVLSVVFRTSFFNWVGVMIGMTGAIPIKYALRYGFVYIATVGQ